MSEDKTFLGRGWSFPPTFERGSSGVKMSESDEDIRESIWIILSTRPGERLMNPDFGCGIHDMVFEDINTTLQSQLKDTVERALIVYEPRIEVLGVEVHIDQKLEGLVNIDVAYNIRQTNTRSNMVYPFYFLEGTDLRN